MKWSNTIAFMLIKDGKILVEKRKLTKRVVPGKIAIPGGYIEKEETPEMAVRRELKEELSIDAIKIRYVCTQFHKAEDNRKLNYYAVDSWEGKINSKEAESLLWVPLTEIDKLDLDVDRIAIKKYLEISEIE